MQRWWKFINKIKRLFLCVSFNIWQRILGILSSNTGWARRNMRVHSRILFRWHFLRPWLRLILFLFSYSSCAWKLLLWRNLIDFWLINTGSIMTEISMIWKLLILLSRWSLITFILMGIIISIIINNFRGKVGILQFFLLYFFKSNSDNFFQLLNFLINFNIR